MNKYPLALQNLIALLKKLPGVGTKTAERFAFCLLNWTNEDRVVMSEAIQSLTEKIQICPECRCLQEENQCYFCDSSHRDPSLLCIISSHKDAYAIEETQTYQGLYHVLECLLSPLDGRSAHTINLEHLKKRIKDLNTQEVVIALDATIEGDATALYLKEKISALGIKVSRLAFGLPMGSPLEYVDGGTLSRAFLGRQIF